MEKLKNFMQGHKMLVGISAIVIVILVALLVIFVPRGNSPTEDDYLSGIGTAPDDSSSESDVDDKDNADEFPNGDSDSETTVNPDEDDKDSEDTTTPVNPDDGDDKNSEDTEEPTKPDNGDDDKDSEDTTEPTEPDDDDKEPVHTCNYNTVKNDSNNHWYVCSCGKTANKSAHNYSNDSDTTCNTCGYTIIPDCSGICPRELNKIIEEINRDESLIRSYEVLSDHCYFFSKKTNSITSVA